MPSFNDVNKVFAHVTLMNSMAKIIQTNAKIMRAASALKPAESLENR